MKFLPGLVIFLVFWSSCTGLSRNNSFVRYSSAFYTVRFPGTLQVNEKGEPVHRPPDTTYVVYVETRGDKPIWERAWYNEHVYTINAELIEQSPIVVGETKSDNRRVSLDRAKENLLWKLELTPADPSNEKVHFKGGDIIIEGIRKKKKFTIKVSGSEELKVPDSV